MTPLPSVNPLAAAGGEPRPRASGREADGGFARALGALRSAHGRPATAPADAAARRTPAAADTAGDARTEDDAAAKPGAARPHEPAGADAAAAPSTPNPTPPPPATAAEDAARRAGIGGEPGPAGGPGAPFVAGAEGLDAASADTASVLATAAASAGTPGGLAAAERLDGSAVAGGRGATPRLAAGAAARTDRPADLAASNPPDLSPQAGPTRDAGGELPGAGTPPSPASRPGDGGGFTAALAGALPTPAPAATGAPPAPAAAPADAQLAAPPGSPAFAAEFSARLTTFVRDGIEHARLHLNPAEMGPVEVRIQITGEAARVVLAAEQAPTRQWLEQALPTLAGTLREAGLTLAGGGVFERAPDGQGQAQGQAGREPAAADGRGRAGGRADEPGPALTAAPALRRRGVVDLVA